MKAPRSALRPARPPWGSRKLAAGFSLIEVLIVMALLAVLASLAMPSYQAQMRRIRRAEAIAAMLAIQQAQERWRASHPTYASGLGEAGVALPASTSSGHHALTTTIDAETGAFAYAVTAAATQPGDDACAQLRLEMQRGTLTQRSGPDAQWANPAGDNRRCWGV